MSDHVHEFDARQLKNGRDWKLTADYLYKAEIDGQAWECPIPKGFEFSTSVPRIFWRIEPPAGPALHASLLHDHLYVVRSAQIDGRKARVDRETADRAYFVMLRHDGMGWFKARLLWSAVRAGGWKAWGDHKTFTA